MTDREKCKAPAGGSVYDRMTNPEGFTGAHAARFGQAPQGGASVTSAAASAKPKAHSGSTTGTATARDKCKGPEGGSVYDRMTNPAGFTGAHAARFGVAPEGGASVKPAAKPAAAAKPVPKESGVESGRDKCKGPSGGSVYDRMTNPAGFTGAHAARFNSDGSGKGLAGRDSIAKGGQAAGLANMVARK
ncbi:p25-alpha family protein [Spironucleus salmonicida]|uniref:P25-alpha family protein n=1 Tax=Spironucleus salmonicida TaxID=348837 RepID=V6LAL0_9EUKA|nr:p25-alpha family protein [Spironucleus salmonicida]KAH0572440.1 p25-alpha family protein [Spironucleus salmonicida]|eukprot:EST41495.1 hypothetical protein SS50377_19223 [Spironucleus salmonicida]